MKVAYAPFTLFADARLCELAILCGGLRMAMTGEEAVALWAEIGKALRYLYDDHPERRPPLLVASLMDKVAGPGQSTPIPAASAPDGLEAIIDYARRPTLPPAAAEQPHSASHPDDGALGRLVRDAFSTVQPKP